MLFEALVELEPAIGRQGDPPSIALGFEQRRQGQLTIVGRQRSFDAEPILLRGDPDLEALRASSVDSVALASGPLDGDLRVVGEIPHQPQALAAAGDLDDRALEKSRMNRPKRRTSGLALGAEVSTSKPAVATGARSPAAGRRD